MTHLGPAQGAIAPSPRRFVLHRHQDGTGVSGTGGVATGVEWPDGHVALRWRADDRAAASSTSVWSSIADLLLVHGHGGRTQLVYLDPADPVGCPQSHHQEEIS